MRNLHSFMLAASLLFLLFSCDQAAQTSQDDEQITLPEAEESLSEPEPASDPYLEKGKEIAEASMKALGGQLKQAIQEGGIPNAIDYCHVQAMPITQSLSEKYGATVRRVSLKYRNPEDAPQGMEKTFLDAYAQAHESGGELKPQTFTKKDGTTLFTAPIVINNALCLNCHGTVGKEVSEEDYALIQERYPEDKAVGYALGDLRGMWSITFPKAD